MEPTLVLLLPDGASRVVPLPGGGPGCPEIVTLGRAADSAVEIDHPAVSRHHLRLLRTPPGDSPAPAASAAWRAEDTGSANGTLHNGDPLGPDPVGLRDGDCLAFGPDLAAVRAIYLDPPSPLNCAPEEDDDPGPDEFPAPGTTLAGRYRLEQTLEPTAEFQPYRATDTENDQAPVALKLFRPGTLPAAGFPVLVARVDRLRGIPSHRGVVRCLDCQRDAGRVFVVTRWVVNGFPTLDLLRARRALFPEEALRLLIPAAAASDHAAEHGQAPLDLSLRATLLTFHPPLANGVESWAGLRRTPLERWHTFVPRFAVAVLAPLPTTAERLITLALFACELLGRPLPDGGRIRPPHIVHPGLGEGGNALLRRVLLAGGSPSGSVAPPAFATAQEFVNALARAAELVPAGAD